MAVYRGVLKKMAGAASMEREWAQVAVTEDFVRVSSGVVGRGWSTTEFVDIGSSHLRHLWLRDNHYELLTEALGQEVSVSTFPFRFRRRRFVLGVRTSGRKTSRLGLGRIIISLIIPMVLKCWLLGLAIALVIGAASGSADVGTSDTQQLSIVIGVFFGILWPAVRCMTLFRDWITVGRKRPHSGDSTQKTGSELPQDAVLPPPPE